MVAQTAVMFGKAAILAGSLISSAGPTRTAGLPSMNAYSAAVPIAKAASAGIAGDTLVAPD